jgi:hypothetical protein
MLGVAAIAVFLSLPVPFQVLSILPATVAALILVPTALAPRARRVEVAYWAMALHPLAYLAWLAFWRFFIDRRDLLPRDSGWYFTLTLALPYFLAMLSRWYLPAFLTVAAPLGLNRFAGRPLAIPLLLMLVVWFST